jgi:transposase
MNPTDGRVYAFCNAQRHQLLYFWWDGAGFQMTRRRRDYGRYVWPPEKLDTSIAVTPAEFAFILYESQQKRSIEIG